MKRALVYVARVGIAVGALVVGFVVFSGLVATKPEPQKRQQADQGLLVQTEEVELVSRPITIDVQGLVMPAEQVTIQSEVTGRVTWLNPALIAGGRVSKGDVLVRIDARDYRLQAKQAAAEIERARVELELERARKQVAEREWKILGDQTNPDEEARARALREPQLRAAKNALEAARSGHGRAKLMIEKTVIRAPFNAVVLSEQVGAGQLVAPQSAIATLVSTDSFHVLATVPTAQLSAMRVPGVNAGPGEGSPATVSHQTGAGHIVAKGNVARLLGDLDPAGQMARVVIGIDDPLALDPKTEREPLLLGSHVMVEIAGGTMSRVAELPRRALRGDSEVFVVTEGLLEVRPVTIAWRSDKAVLVTAGLREDEQVVLSTIAAPVPGMKLRSDPAARTAELTANPASK